MRTRHKYNQDTESEYVTVTELAQMLDVSPEEAFEWARLHGLDGSRLTRAQAERLVLRSEDAEAAAEDATWD